MIDSAVLLETLQRQLGSLLDDLRDRVESVPEVGEPLRAEYQAAFDAERTGWTFTEWAEDRLTQVAVGWLLACVFVRFCEDNGLIDDAMLAGDGHRGTEARAHQQDFFRANPHESDRGYLHHVFRTAAQLPGLSGVLGEGHNPLWLVDPSADACTELLGRFRRNDDSGALVLEFSDPELDTRFLGDLYQDLSEHAKKTYALLQTPEFVEEFILDRTLDPAIESHGLADTTLIDPTCGSGHFLLGAFDRLWQRWHDAEPASPAHVVAQRALDAVWGVDINPFAAAIARFRLLVAALKRSGLHRLADAPDFDIHVAVGDSLLWGAREQHLPGLEGAGLAADRLYLYATEDAEALRETFRRTYAAVVGNPPYIVPKDKASNAAYRNAFSSCHRKYSLGVPFTELFFRLAHRPNAAAGAPAGYVGLITANSFMKREMGKKLVEDHIPNWDLTHVIDTSGAYIPGHGTPTVILFGRNQPPVAEVVRTVMGIRGEPSTPDDPAKGLVWTAIVDQIDAPGSESEFISVADTARSRFASHPWSIGGGGAAELKELIEASRPRLDLLVSSIGVGAISAEDDAFQVPNARDLSRRRAQKFAKPLIIGEGVRDWRTQTRAVCIFPYSHQLEEIQDDRGSNSWLWPYKTVLGNRVTFSKRTYYEEGRAWWEWHQVALERIAQPVITFPHVSTNNHFALDTGGKVFNRSAPIISLKSDAFTQAEQLVGVMNSSVASFWMKQTLFNKGGGGSSSKLAADAWENFFDFDGGKLKGFPLPETLDSCQHGIRLVKLASALSDCEQEVASPYSLPTRNRLDEARSRSESLLAEMISWQEELDWHCLHLYGLTDEPLTVPEGQEPPPLALGERAFEIVLARQVAAGEVETAWFERHHSTPIIELPSHWPEWYRDLVNRRIQLIESDRNVGLVERPEHKRRWNRPSWEELEQAALRDWLLDRLEDRSLWFEGGRAVVRTVAQLADRVATDPDWMEVARTWRGRTDVDPVAVITDLIADEHVPAQAAARYKPSGLTKRVEWERTWELQRAEDRGEDVGRIPVPPKYQQSDFLRPSYWRLRGKLDVPKERFTSIIGAERDPSAGDSTMVLAWAGFDHAQLAQALATLLYQRQTVDGWSGEQLIPLIAALDEVIPWVEQWHPEVDPGLGQPLGAFYRGQVDQALATIGATRATLAEWAPPAPTRGRRRRTAPASTPDPAS